MHRTVWILLFFCSTVTAQEIVPVTPVWKRSFGMRDNTSRDTLTHAARDRDGNVILAGGTEEDTTFSDIVVRKLSPDGALMWEFRYSTDRGVGYDLPLNLFVSREDEIYLVGYARSTYFYQHAGLYDTSGTCVRMYTPASTKLDMRGLPTGIYRLELREAGGGVSMQNIIHVER